MTRKIVPMVDLAKAKQRALEVAREWQLHLGDAFALSNVSYVVAVDNDKVLKIGWEGDDEGLHEGDALELWNGDGAVRLLRRDGPALLEERVLPGTDLSEESEETALDVVVAVANKLWQRVEGPFRSVLSEIPRWIDEGEDRGGVLAPLARELLATMKVDNWLVHGDLHHHNILRSAHSYVAIDPKPWKSSREYDVASFLWNPIDHDIRQRDVTERRIAAFVDAGLDDELIRKWAIIRGSYLRIDDVHSSALRALLD